MAVLSAGAVAMSVETIHTSWKTALHQQQPVANSNRIKVQRGDERDHVE